MKILFVLAGFLLFLHAGAACPRKPIEVVAHRGGAAEWNLADSSLESFLKTSQQVAPTTFLELDVNMSIDRKFVISHDPTLTRDLCEGFDGQTFDIMDHRVSSIEKIRCRSSGGGHRSGVISLRRLLASLERAENTSPLSIEIKSSWDPLHGTRYFPQRVLVDRMLHFLAALPKGRRIVLYSFDPEIIELLRRGREHGAANFQIGYYENNVLDTNWAATVAKLRRLRPDYFSPNFSFIGDDSTFRREVEPVLKSLGIHFVPWTLNSPSAWESAISDYCADGIITDTPSAFEGWLSWKAGTRTRRP